MISRAVHSAVRIKFRCEKVKHTTRKARITRARELEIFVVSLREGCAAVMELERAPCGAARDDPRAGDSLCGALSVISLCDVLLVRCFL